MSFHRRTKSVTRGKTGTRAVSIPIPARPRFIGSDHTQTPRHHPLSYHPQQYPLNTAAAFTTAPDDSAWYAAHLVGLVRASIEEARAVDCCVLPAPETTLQALWFRPLSLESLLDDPALAHRLRLLGMPLAFGGVNLVTGRLRILYNQQVMERGEPDAICALAVGISELTTRLLCERQQREMLDIQTAHATQASDRSAGVPSRLMRRVRALLRQDSECDLGGMSGVPCYGVLLLNQRVHLVTLGRYDTPMLREMLAHIYQGWLDIRPAVEYRTIPNLPIWREARGG